MSKLTIYRWDTHGHSSIKIKEICHFSFTSSSLHPSYSNQTEVPLSTEHHNWVLSLFITARKRSLGQGNIFYTCLSFCSRGEVCYPSMHCRWYPSMPCWGSALGGCLVLGGLPGPRRVPALGGACSWGMCLVETPQMATAGGSMHPTGMHSC